MNSNPQILSTQYLQYEYIYKIWENNLDSVSFIDLQSEWNMKCQYSDSENETDFCPENDFGLFENETDFCPENEID